MIKKQEKKWYENHFLTALIVLVTLMILIVVFNPNLDNIVVTFIASLATFVVVGNYAQVIVIRDDLNNKIIDMSKKIELIDTQFRKLISFLLATFEDLLRKDKTEEAFAFFFDNYSKEFEKATLAILWKYFGGMYIGSKKSKEEEDEFKKKYEDNLKRAENLGVSDEFINYMGRAFLSNGSVTIGIKE